MKAPRGSWALAWAALLVLALRGADAACRVRLEVDAGASTFLLTSSNALIKFNATTPITSAAAFNRTVPRGFSGALFAVSTSLAACPGQSDRAAWLAAFPSFSLSSSSGVQLYEQALAVYPAMHLGRTALAGIAGNPVFDYNLTDIRISVAASGIAPNAAAGGSNFTASWATQVANAWISTRNTITGARVDSLANLTANASAVPLTLDLQTSGGAAVLVAEVPLLNLTYATYTVTTMFSSSYHSYANYTLTARLVAKGSLGCSSYCGDWGRCSAEGGSAKCACDCGWRADASGACTIPWGYCSVNGTTAGTAAGGGEEPAPAPPDSPSLPPPSCVAGNSSQTAATVPPVDGACPAGFDWDAYGVACSACPAGFSGHQCGFCASDSACKASMSSSTAQCSLSPLYRPRTASKRYSCAINDRTIAAILGDAMEFSCSTTPPVNGTTSTSANDFAVGSGIVTSSTPIGTTPYCTMSFRLSGMPRDAAVQCTGWACRFNVNSTKANCPFIKCTCPKGCSNAEGTITEATFTSLNSAVSIACGSDAGMGSTSADSTTGCKITLTGLPFTSIPATCKTAECIDPVNGTVLVTQVEEESETSLDKAPIIAWVPTFVLLLVAIMLAIVAWGFGALIGRPPAAPAAAAAATGGKGSTGRAGPVAEGAEDGSGSAAVPAVAAEPASLPPLAASPSGRQQQLSPPPSPPAAVSTQPQQQQQQQQQRQVLPGQLPTPPYGTPREGNSTATQEGGPGASSETSSSSNTSAAPPAGSPAGAAEAAAAAAAPGRAQEQEADAAVVVAAEGASVGIRELSWHGLTVSTRPRRSLLRPWAAPKRVTLLQGVSGVARSGEVLGVLGPSGSGKTTLLNILSGLIQRGAHWDVGGSVAVDGHDVRSPRHLTALVGHVPQHDLLARSLTVYECVAAAATLRSSWRDVTGAGARERVRARVAHVLEDLGISHLAHRVVWPGGAAPLGAAPSASAGGSLSGGERLRVSAALELVADPPVLLLDEPLSGLDSATARATMAVLRAVAAGVNGDSGAGGAGGRVVVASMHQPSPVLYGMLDGVLLMAGGRVAYFGPPGGAAAAVAAAGLPAAPPEVPIADHLLDLVADPQHAAALFDSAASRGGGGGGGRKGVGGGGGSDAASASASGGSLSGGGGGGGGASKAGLEAASGGGAAPGAGNGTAGGGSAASAPSSSSADADASYVRALLRARAAPGGGVGQRLRRWWLELGVLSWRAGLDMLRNPAMAALHVVVTAAIGLLVGAVFSNTELDVSGAQNRVGAIFFAVMLLACFATSAVDGIFPERAIVDRDLLRATYGVLPYMVSWLTADAALLRVLPAWAFGVPFYWLMGLRPQATAFFTFLGAFTTMSCIGGAACLALCCVLSSPGKAVLVLNLLLLVCALFSGFLANKDAIVVWLRWILYVSPIRFCWEALVINEMDPLVLNFSSPDLPQGLPAVRGSLFLALLGVDNSMLLTDLIVLGCMYGILVIVAVAVAALRVTALRGRWK